MQYHGGDIYRNQIRLDFSVNTNPLGMPDPVKEALHQVVEEAENYPDIRAQALSAAVAEQLQVRKEHNRDLKSRLKEVLSTFEQQVLAYYLKFFLELGGMILLFPVLQEPFVQSYLSSLNK